MSLYALPSFRPPLPPSLPSPPPTSSCTPPGPSRRSAEKDWGYVQILITIYGTGVGEPNASPPCRRGFRHPNKIRCNILLLYILYNILCVLYPRRRRRRTQPDDRTQVWHSETCMRKTISSRLRGCVYYYKYYTRVTPVQSNLFGRCVVSLFLFYFLPLFSLKQNEILLFGLFVFYECCIFLYVHVPVLRYQREVIYNIIVDCWKLHFLGEHSGVLMIIERSTYL